MQERPSDKAIKSYSRARLNSRQIDELIGISKGMLADGVINQGEAEYLQAWFVATADVSDNPLMLKINNRLGEMLADGHLDKKESTELLELLNKFSGGCIKVGELMKATSLPLDDPQPKIVFKEKSFCFTGTFTYGSRKDCERAVIERGAFVSGVTKKLDYLVIGAYATDSWKHSSMGNKILKTIEYREDKMLFLNNKRKKKAAGYSGNLSIISEEHWESHLEESNLNGETK